ncbi:MAG TPA: metabolite traffic protein EboE [Candidatus Azoamicus sp. OHIO2]
MIIQNKSLTYCSNIFKEQDITKLLKILTDYVFFIRKHFKCKYIGLGLCVSNTLINNVLNIHNLSYLRTWLIKYNLYISSINGFVYKSFHTKKIKEHIHYPDWTSSKRVDYTKKIIYFLSAALTKMTDVSISTSPLSFKTWIRRKNAKYIFFKSSVNILYVLQLLINMYKNKKHYIHLDIEPEPYCLLESVNDFLYFFIKWLIPNSKLYLHLLDKKNKASYLRKYINLCYDICHFSVNYYNHIDIIKSIVLNKIKVGKIQVSSALEATITNDNYKIIMKELLFLNKSKFLHQNTLVTENKIFINKHIDLNYEVLKGFCNDTKLRIHCHMPLHLTKYRSYLDTTTNESKDVFLTLLKCIKIKHIEIETYTYDILLKNKKFESMLQEYLIVIDIIKTSKHD